MIKNPSDATVRRIMKGNDVGKSAIQLANSGYIKISPATDLRVVARLARGRVKISARATEANLNIIRAGRYRRD